MQGTAHNLRADNVDALALLHSRCLELDVKSDSDFQCYISVNTLLENAAGNDQIANILKHINDALERHKDNRLLIRVKLESLLHWRPAGAALEFAFRNDVVKKFCRTDKVKRVERAPPRNKGVLSETTLEIIRYARMYGLSVGEEDVKSFCDNLRVIKGLDARSGLNKEGKEHLRMMALRLQAVEQAQNAGLMLFDSGTARASALYMLACKWAIQQGAEKPFSIIKKLKQKGLHFLAYNDLSMLKIAYSPELARIFEIYAQVKVEEIGEKAGGSKKYKVDTSAFRDVFPVTESKVQLLKRVDIRELIDNGLRRDAIERIAQEKQVVVISKGQNGEGGFIVTDRKSYNLKLITAKADMHEITLRGLLDHDKGIMPVSNDEVQRLKAATEFFEVIECDDLASARQKYDLLKVFEPVQGSGAAPRYALLR